MDVKISNQIYIKNPSDEIEYYLKDMLTLDNPAYSKALRAGRSIRNIPSQLCLWKKNGKELIIPIGIMNEIKGLIDNADIDLADNGHVEYNANVPLYDYQQKAVDEIAKKSNGILNSPCGSGKTQMGIALITRLGVKSLWLTHTKDLLDQSYDRAKQYIDEKMLGKITSGKIEIGEGITFATVQTLSKQDLDEWKYAFDCIVVDECHRCAGTATGVTMFSKVLNSLAARYKYGLSATVHRADGLIKATFSLIGPIRYSVPESAVADKTMTVRIKRVDTRLRAKADEYTEVDGTLDYNKMTKLLVESDIRTEDIARQILADKEHSQIVLSTRLKHLESIIDKIKELGYDAELIRCINGKMTSKKAKQERHEALEDMRTGRAKILFASYTLAKEGLDIPQLDRLHLALPQKDYAVIVQSIGRIGRTASGKTDAICYDYVDSSINYCVTAYKKRCTHYRKSKCNITN